MFADVVIAISPLDRFDVAAALDQAVAQKRSIALNQMKPGIRRDNILARCIRLEEIAKRLRDHVETKRETT